MQELEKILEEIKESAIFMRTMSGYGAMCVSLGAVKRIIHKHMNDSWIPASKPPETGKRCLVKMKHHAWISDYDSDWVPENEKVYHSEYTEICEAIYQDDGMWSYYDLVTENGRAFTKPEENKSYPVEEVLEWKYMPQLQPETCKYTGGSCCWPIDQCSNCPNHPERSEGE